MAYNFLFKFIVVGDCSVGKSCLLRRFESNEFSNIVPSTIGMEFVRKTINIDDNSIVIQVWDTAGQENMFSLTANYYKSTCAILLVYDVTRRETFFNLKKWMTQIDDNANQTAKRILIGNKTDLDFERIISKSEGEAFGKEHKLPYIETSAKTSKNVIELFNKIAHEVYFDMIKGNIKIDENGTYGIKQGSLTKNFNQISHINRETHIKKTIKLSFNTAVDKTKCCK